MMKKISALLASVALAFSAAAANASPPALSAGPNEVVVTAKQVLVGKNVHDFEVHQEGPGRSVMVVDLHDPMMRGQIIQCEQMQGMALIAATLTPEERLENALRANDHSMVQAVYRTKITISDAEGPVDPVEAKERARQAVAQVTVVNSDRMLADALKICKPAP